MELFSVFILLLFLFFGGILVGIVLVVENVMPSWLILPFLLPAAILLDRFFSAGTYSWKVTKYSTTLGLICLTLIGFLLTEFEAFRTFSWVVLVLVFLVPLFFLPEILFYLLWTVILGIEDYRQKKKR